MPAIANSEIDHVTDETSRQVEGQFREMPGLRLTEVQAARLFALDVGTCRRVLRSLVAAGVLVETRGVVFARAEEVQGGA